LITLLLAVAAIGIVAAVAFGSDGVRAVHDRAGVGLT
jgi:acyl-coenzyme A synthetase/AMP-(fatty) acid ligase